MPAQREVLTIPKSQKAVLSGVKFTCTNCKRTKPASQFGMRKMGDGLLRNQAWCRTCRGNA